MDDPIVLRMSEGEIQRRLLEIRQRYGINATLLVNLLKSPEFSRMAGEQLSKHAKRKARRQLSGSEAAFGVIAKILEQHKTRLTALGDEYHQFINARLSENQRQAYKTGNWTPEILELVSTAQRKYYYARPPSPAEVQKKVQFKPAGNYRRKWNR